MFSRIWRGLDKKIYFDYCSITPLDRRVVKVMEKAIKTGWQNPSSLYASGVAASKQLESTRESVAKILSGTSGHSVHADEIVFTSGGTEANNIAIQGVINHYHRNHGGVPHIISTNIEHPSVKKTIEHFVSEHKITASFIPVTEEGTVDLMELKKVLQTEKNIALISVMMVNNEIGTVQPLAEIASLLRKYRKENGGVYPLFHSDACQAPCYLDMQLDKLGVDFMSFDGGKIYGPRGVGCLYIKRRSAISKIYFGGAQEMDIRPGTENLPAILGFAEALEICQKEKNKEVTRLQKLQEYFFKKLPGGVYVNGSKTERIVNNINMCVPGKDSEFLLFKFDVAGFEVSTGTTCQNKQEDSRSYVVDSLGKNCGGSSLRISMGRWTKKGEVVKFLKVLKKILIV